LARWLVRAIAVIPEPPSAGVLRDQSTKSYNSFGFHSANRDWMSGLAARSKTSLLGRNCIESLLMRSPVSVLHVLKHFRPTYTGEGMFTERLVAVMDTVAPNVSHEMLAVDTPQPHGPPYGCSAFERVTHLTGIARPAVIRQALLWWWLLRNLRRYDVIHFHTHVDRYFIAYLIAKLSGKRLLLSATLDDSVPGLLKTYRERFRKLALRGLSIFDGYVSLSPKCHNETLTVVAAEKAHLIPNGIHLPNLDDGSDRVADRHRFGIAEHDIVLIFVGGICARKDPLYLVQQLPTILAPSAQVKLLIVGPILEQEYYDQMIEYLKAHDLVDRVIFTGGVPDAYPLYRIADVLTFTSWLEGCPAAVIEAMAHGLPVVVRDLPGINDSIVIHGKTGFQFGSEQDYIATVHRLIREPDLRHRVGSAARRFVVNHFDVVDIAREYLKLYGVTVADEPADPGDRHSFRDLVALPASASIIDERFHRPLRVPAEQRPLLLTTVDAEEDFDWTKPFSRTITDVRSMAHQHLAHAIFERHGVSPVYLLDYPVASQNDGYAPLIDYIKDGKCEIGTQLHPWVNPPLVEELNSANSFPGNLPLPLEFEKLRILTETIEDRVGVRPLVYRAGRYGVGPRTADILKRLGYVIDTSVVPQRSFAYEGGPDFFSFSVSLYWADAEYILLEIPVTAAVVGVLAPQAIRLRRQIFHSDNRRSLIAAALARSRTAEQIKLTPEGITLDEAKKLVRAMLARGFRVFNLTYHSTSLVPGSTPYVRTREDRDRLLRWLDQFYDFFFGDIGGLPTTAKGVYDLAVGLTLRCDSDRLRSERPR